ncbi:MAG: AAA family ATPase [Candidatus Xenobium sp.]|jgi:MoxR-like ATPase|nr:MoxR family ATPase [Burkholderiales bacterium]
MRTSPNPLFTRLVENLERVVQGKTRPLQFLVVSLFSGGHVLMEDVPGVGKTTLAKALAASIRGSFRRVQFTPDLLPTDILGSSIYNPREGTFDFHQGPVFCNILLADEINRASPRTQSSLLEAMSEGQATIEGVTRTLPHPFVVLATQNPIEFHGTYPLPEAQLDRFTMRLTLGYPDRDHELAVLEAQRQQHPLEELEAVTDLDEVMGAQEAVRQVRVERPISEYILALVQATREDPRLKLGSSTRGALALYRTAQALAWCEGRDYVLPDDVKTLSIEVLAHRVMLETKSRYSGVSREALVAEIVGRTPPTP